MRLIDLTHQRFGRLTVIGYEGARQWLCRCDCGNETVIASFSLRDGRTQSCGCFQKERTSETHYKHGRGHNDRTYKSWCGMRERVLNPDYKRYGDWGGRGIRICRRWEKFENFLADMGERPPRHVLDRINNNGHYTPKNCRWATYLESNRNRHR